MRITAPKIVGIAAIALVLAGLATTPADAAFRPLKWTIRGLQSIRHNSLQRRASRAGARAQSHSAQSSQTSSGCSGSSAASGVEYYIDTGEPTPASTSCSGQ